MAKHPCQVPNTNAKRWKCPTCKRVWTLQNVSGDGKGADLWHGRENIRHANGSPVSTSFWDWLTS